MNGIGWRSLLPDAASDPGWSHSGIAVTDSGTIIYAEASGGGLIFIRPDAGETSTVERRPVPLLEIHGIYASRDAGGEVLWLADPGFKARRELGYETESAPGQAGSLDLTSFEFSALTPPPPSGADWRPTSVVATRAHDCDPSTVIVADGYGASLLHFYVNGALVRTIDGGESGTVFACPHGLALDGRSGHTQLVVADRGNRRLVFSGWTGAS